MKYWLMKSEPESYSIDALKRDKVTAWTGVRNYQARNFMTKGMSVGDLALFYHSNAEPSGVVGLMVIASGAKADATAQDRKSETFDPKASAENPIWECVDVKFKEKFAEIVPLPALRDNPKLAKMELLRKGSRLSIQPVTPAEFREILRMAGSSALI